MHLVPILIAAMLVGIPLAQNASPSGSFESEFEVVTDNCKGEGLSLEKATIEVAERGKTLTVKVPELPALSGSTGRKGKVRAEVSAPTKTPGMSARYGLNARITADSLQGVFVAEYFRAAKPHCTKSFSVSGKRSKR